MAVALLSLITCLAWVPLKDIYSSYTLKADSRQIARMLKSARQEAIATGEPQLVLFYHNDNSIKFMGKRYRFSPEVQYASIPNFTTSVGGVKACRFNPTGAPGSGGVVVLKNRRQEKTYIIVSAVAGRIRISDQPPDNW